MRPSIREQQRIQWVDSLCSGDKANELATRVAELQWVQPFKSAKSVTNRKSPIDQISSDYRGCSPWIGTQLLSCLLSMAAERLGLGTRISEWGWFVSLSVSVQFPDAPCCVVLPVLLASDAADDPAADQAPVSARPVRGGRGRAQRRGLGTPRLPEEQTGCGSEERRDERVRRPLHPRPAAHTHRTGENWS